MNKPDWIKQIESKYEDPYCLVEEHISNDVEALLSALNKAYEVIERTREIILSGAEGAICDTIWESSCGTLVDYLDNFLFENPDQQKLPLTAINQEGK